MKKYVIQVYDYAPYTHKMRKMWRTLPGLEFDTLEEAKATFSRIGGSDYRIAEAYTQIRYKPVPMERSTP